MFVETVASSLDLLRSTLISKYSCKNGNKEAIVVDCSSNASTCSINSFLLASFALIKAVFASICSLILPSSASIKSIVSPLALLKSIDDITADFNPSS